MNLDDCYEILRRFPGTGTVLVYDFFEVMQSPARTRRRNVTRRQATDAVIAVAPFAMAL